MPVASYPGCSRHFFCLSMKEIIVYTDGAYSSSRNQGGIGIVILKEGKKVIEYSKMFRDTTNNKMELSAIIVALRCIKAPVDRITIYSDSMYCIGCATDWKRKKNIHLWEVFDTELARVKRLCPKVEFLHVKGHGDSEWNNYCDKLAVAASQQL